jgi:hypothetical protein
MSQCSTMGGLNLAGDNMQSAGREDRVYFLSSVLFSSADKEELANDKCDEAR